MEVFLQLFILTAGESLLVTNSQNFGKSLKKNKNKADGTVLWELLKTEDKTYQVILIANCARKRRKASLKHKISYRRVK